MYERCVSSNKFLDGAELVKIDNSTENTSISVRYNSFINKVLYRDCWIVFCHEDWMAREPILPIIRKQDKGRLYGNVGIRIERHKRFDYIVLFGGLMQSNKDGGERILVKGFLPSSRVTSFDCQLIAVHTSLLRRSGLRFDENLKFHLYVEDFCASACEKGIECWTIDIKSEHYSYGVVSDEFYESLEYLRKKYIKSSNRYCSPAGICSSFGGLQNRPLKIKHRTVLRRMLMFIKRIFAL